MLGRRWGHGEVGLERMETHLHVRRGDDGILIEIVIAIAIVIVRSPPSRRIAFLGSFVTRPATAFARRPLGIVDVLKRLSHSGG